MAWRCWFEWMWTRVAVARPAMVVITRDRRRSGDRYGLLSAMVVLASILAVPDVRAEWRDGPLLTSVEFAQPQRAMVINGSGEHGKVLAAGFGFESEDMSFMVVKTYDAASGSVLAENVYDLHVAGENDTNAQAKSGRVFAGGIGRDIDGSSKFLLRVYEADSGKFLWEGQLNLTRQSSGSPVVPVATAVRRTPSALRVSSSDAPRLDVNLSLRAVDPRSGTVVWGDDFIPGSRISGKSERMGNSQHTGVDALPGIGLVFDLLVRTYEGGTGRLLWRDTFGPVQEEREGTASESDGDEDLDVHRLPLWKPHRTTRPGVHLIRVEAGYDRAAWCLAERLSAHCFWN